MTWRGKIAWGLLAAFVAIQAIRPKQNRDKGPQPADFVTRLSAPPEVARILHTSCYNCHSNNTDYPWYAAVQPAGWYLAHHIKEGKAELNFHQFTNYSARRQYSKLRGVRTSIEEGTMPLPSYTWLHPEAKLPTGEKAILLQWLNQKIDSVAKEE